MTDLPFHIEQEVNRALLTDEEIQNDYFSEFNVNALMRADAKTRALFYRIMREVGAFCANDIRDQENENPLPPEIGEEYLRPANMVPAGSPTPRLTAL